jgi:NAD dependent epimerase/dehydratase family enzyme
MLARLLFPFEFGLGGPVGAGTQWMSWIERDDLVRLIAHIMATPQLAGAVNATAPNPVTNASFAQALGAALCRPAGLRIPAAALRLAGDLARELLLGGQRVLPDKAQASGFAFRHETLSSALTAMLPMQWSDDVAR